MDKFDWQASESAPRNYPMRIVSGNLSYQDGSGSLYVPDGSRIGHGWGTGISSHVVGADLKPLPNKLAITFFSYTENQFYRGKFDLPYEKILALFKAGYYSPNQGKHITYHKIVVGVAPGGAVSVWLVGLDKTIEVFFGDAEKFEGNWRSVTSNTNISREEYVRSGVEESLKAPEVIEALRKNGIPFGLWASYRTHYLWQPLFTGMSVRDGLINEVSYFNGEFDYLAYPQEVNVVASPRTIPRQIYFIWEYTKVQGRSYELTFNEVEIFDAFRKLGNSGPSLQLEMRMAIADGGKQVFSVWLRNDKESIELSHTGIEIYGVSDRKVEEIK